MGLIRKILMGTALHVFLFRLMLMLTMITFSQSHIAWHFFLIPSTLLMTKHNSLLFPSFSTFFPPTKCSSIYSSTYWHVLCNHERARLDRFLMSLISFLISIMRAWHLGWTIFPIIWKGYEQISHNKVTLTACNEHYNHQDWRVPSPL